MVKIVQQDFEHPGGHPGGRHKFAETAPGGGLGVPDQIAVDIRHRNTPDAVLHRGGPGQADEPGGPGKQAEMFRHLVQGEPMGLDLPDILVA
jgi:hypothetical protein